MDCRNGFSAEALWLWLEREDFEGRGQGHGHRCAAQRRPENRDHHQAHGGQRSGTHTGIDRVRIAGGWKGIRMRSSFLHSATIVLVAFAISAVSLAQTAKPSGAATGTPDLSGTWNRGTGHTAAGTFD